MEETGVDEVYYCPHYENGGIAEYSVPCSCRKPKTGMIDAAVRKYGIDISLSYMIGDRAADVLSGQSAGLKTILLESGYGSARLEKPVKPDYILEDLKEAVKILPR